MSSLSETGALGPWRSWWWSWGRGSVVEDADEGAASASCRLGITASEIIRTKNEQ